MDHSTKQTIVDWAKTLFGIVSAVMTIIGIKRAKKR